MTGDGLEPQPRWLDRVERQQVDWYRRAASGQGELHLWRVAETQQIFFAVYVEEGEELTDQTKGMCDGWHEGIFVEYAGLSTPETAAILADEIETGTKVLP